MSLYVRISDKSGEEILSMYPAEVPFSVYSVEEYYQTF